MAFVGLKVPHETARLLEGADVPGQRHSASDMHVTILYLGQGVPVIEVAKAMCASYNVASTICPFLCSLEQISSFPKNPDDGVPIICPVESPDLHELRNCLQSEFDRLGIGYSNKYPEYKPHVTLAYDRDGETGYESKLPSSLSWIASELVIWGGDEGDGTLFITIPFVLSPVERIAKRLME